MPDRKAARTRGSGAGRRGRLALRIALIGVAGGAGALALYLAVARAFLSTGRLRALVNAPPASTWIDYDEARSLWPGRIRVRNFRIRGSDDNVQWIVRLEEAALTFSLPDLVSRKFHVLRARGSGLSFRLRKIRKPGDPSPAPLSLVPPIPGFPDPPLPSKAVRRLSPGDPWTVQVEGLAIDRLSEIWIEVYRSRGRARLEGGFFLRSGLEASVGPAAIEFLDGDVRIGEEPVLSSRRGRVACRIETYDPRETRGDAVWKKTTGLVSLEGEIEAMRFLNYFLRRSPEPRLSGGAGTLRIGARIDRGVSRGQVRLSARRLEARTAVAALRGDAGATLRIARWDLERGPLDFSGSRLEVADVRSLSEGSRDWWGRFDFPKGRLDRMLTGRVEAKCRDARPLLSLLAANLPKWTRGLLEMEGLEASADVTIAGPDVRVRGLDAKGGSFHIEGDYRKNRGEKAGVFLIDAGKINVGVAVRGGKTSLHLIGARGWFERARAVEYQRRGAGDQPACSTTTAVP